MSKINITSGINPYLSVRVRMTTEGGKKTYIKEQWNHVTKEV